jgi:hypothetical protein
MLIIPFYAIIAQENQSSAVSRWKVAAHAGMGRLLASTERAEKIMTDELFVPSRQVEDYYGKLRTGLVLSGDIHYIIKNIWGVGVKYLNSRNSTSGDLTVDMHDRVNFFTLRPDEKIYLNYIGPSLLVQRRIGKGNKWMCSVQASAGYAMFRDEVRFAPNIEGFNNYLVKGGALGENVELSVEYFLLRHLSVAAGASLFRSVFGKVKYVDAQRTQTISLEKENYENLSHISISIGLKYHF